MSVKNIAIIGAGGLGKEMLVLIHQINALEPQWNVVGFYDDHSAASIAGLPVLGKIETLNSGSLNLAVIIAVGDPLVKKKIASRLINPALYFPSLIHPAATVGSNIKVGAGTIITAGCRLTVDIDLGKHVLLNLNTTVGHDVTIGDYSSIMPGVHLSGYVNIGTGVMIGTGASVLQQLKVGDQSKVGAGALVTTDVITGTTVVGIPAREKTGIN